MVLGDAVVPRDDVVAGAHLCAFHSGPVERDDLVVEFLHAGLRTGDMCVCLLDGMGTLDGLGRHMPRGAQSTSGSSPHLEVGSVWNICERSRGFTVDQMVTYIANAAAVAAERDFPRLRVAMEMSSVLPGPPCSEEYVAYESAINRVVKETASALMFLYDLEQFGTGMLIDVLKTHPTVLVGRAVLDNRHVLSPADYFASQGHRNTSANPGPPRRPVEAARTADASRPPHDEFSGLVGRAALGQDTVVDDGWRCLTEAERRITDLVAVGLTNKAIAERLILSSHTVDAHLKHVYAKLGIHSRVELTVVALRHKRSVPRYLPSGRGVTRKPEQVGT
jgi:DNA-binding CsgD family transcriptional regulator